MGPPRATLRAPAKGQPLATAPPGAMVCAGPPPGLSYVLKSSEVISLRSCTGDPVLLKPLGMSLMWPFKGWRWGLPEALLPWVPLSPADFGPCSLHHLSSRDPARGTAQASSHGDRPIPMGTSQFPQGLASVGSTASQGPGLSPGGPSL